MNRPPTTSYLCALLLGIILGCSPKIDRVYVDLTGPIEEPGSGPDSNVFSIEGVEGASLSTSAKAASTLLFGVSEERYLAAVKENQASRRASTQALADALFGALDAQIEDARRAAKSVLSAEDEILMNDAVARTRPVFEKYADEVGTLTLELSGLTEFPDKGPIGDSDSAKAKRAQEIRSRLRKLEAQYIDEREAVFAEVQAMLRSRRTELEAQLDAKRAQEAKRIEATVAAMVSRGVVASPNPALARLKFTLPASDGASADLPRAAGRAETFRTKRPRPISRAALKTQAETWAALNGYKLTEDPKRGADKSKEFWAWRSALQHGP